VAIHLVLGQSGIESHGDQEYIVLAAIFLFESLSATGSFPDPIRTPLLEFRRVGRSASLRRRITQVAADPRGR
jgi:hypothetical protein